MLITHAAWVMPKCFLPKKFSNSIVNFQAQFKFRVVDEGQFFVFSSDPMSCHETAFFANAIFDSLFCKFWNIFALFMPLIIAPSQTFRRLFDKRQGDERRSIFHSKAWESLVVPPFTRFQKVTAAAVPIGDVTQRHPGAFRVNVATLAVIYR